MSHQYNLGALHTQTIVIANALVFRPPVKPESRVERYSMHVGIIFQSFNLVFQ